MSHRSQKPQDNNQITFENKTTINESKNSISMAGKTPKEMQSFLLSGEPDDLSFEVKKKQ